MTDEKQKARWLLRTAREEIALGDYDKAADIWGMDITVCTTARNDDEARALLTAFNFPFRQ